MNNIFKAILALAIVLSVVGVAQALPVTIGEVEIDDTNIDANALNRLDLERGEQYDVRVELTTAVDLDDLEVRLFVSGFEFNDIDEIGDRTQVFDADANVTYVKRFKITIPDEVEEDDYKLRLIVSDRFSDELIQSYNLKIDVPRHAVTIEDVVFSPSNSIRAGSALLTTVRVENKGEKDQEDVKVTVDIPALGISGSEYIDEIENDDEEEETEEIFLRIPKCSKAGTYDVLVSAEFSQRHRKVTERMSITVLEDDTCNETAGPATTITLGNQMQHASAGTTAVFPITVTNAGKTSKSYVVSVPSADWATVTVTPTSMLVVPAGTTKTVFANVAVSEDAPAGAHSLAATVASGSEAQELTLTAHVAEADNGVKGVFEIVLIVLVVLLVILGIAIGISHYKSNEPETYY